MLNKWSLDSHEKQKVDKAPVHGQHLEVDVHQPDRVGFHVLPDGLDGTFEDALGDCLTLWALKMVHVEL